jgi:hypothetical protein
METALYFPYIRIPETAWFTQMLLYWDAGAAIVPRALQDDETALGQYMLDLTRAGLLELVHPDEVLWQQQSAYNENFMAVLDRHIAPADEGRQWVHVHVSKLNWDLFDAMAGKGLARNPQGPEREIWWDVEASTAGLYMTYLAGAICGDREGFFPVTDTSVAITTLATSTESTDRRLRTLRYAIITRALPAPSHPVPVRELVEFKEKNYEQLQRLRIHLDGRLADLAVIEDQEVLRAKMDSILQEIHDDVESLSEKMTRSAWPRIILLGFGGMLATTLALGATVATGGEALALGLAVGSGAASVGRGAYEAAEAMRAPRADYREPLMYAALAKCLTTEP